MSKSTPFFFSLRRLLFGKPRLSEIEKLLRVSQAPHSLSQYQNAFGHLFPEALLACEPKGIGSRVRIFPPIVTFWAFLAQVLERGSSCRDALRRIGAWLQFESPTTPLPSTQTGGYCQARARLADATLDQISSHLADQLERNLPSQNLWMGRRVKVVDGTSASMPDTKENQAAWPQPGQQKPGCGFPVVKLVGLLSLGSGALLQFEEGNKHQHEIVLARKLWRHLEPRDIILADRGFCSFQDFSEIAALGADAVMRLHQARSEDFRTGRHLGPGERLLTWRKPAQATSKATPEAYAKMPDSITVRMLRYRIEEPGFRTREVVLATTLLDAQKWPAQALAELYFQRWSVELHFREIKTLLGMDVLRCQSPVMVRKEIAMHRIAYNLVRTLMQNAAIVHHIPLGKISFKGTLDSLHHFADAMQALAGKPRRQAHMLAKLLETIAQDPLLIRPGRVEPRAKKRRAKNYQLLTSPRRTMHTAAHRNRVAKTSQTSVN